MTHSMNSESTSTAKTVVFNLIILDESGSMSHVKNETIAGCNELINTIKTAKRNGGDKLRSLLSIYAFQSDGNVPSRYLVKNADPENVRHITPDDYKPWGRTPLLDAVGSTLSELMAVSETHEDATGAITIMTDGYENSSKQYDWQKVAQLISRFKEMGWTVNLVGANIDVAAMASRMSIDSENALQYQQTGEGSRKMWDQMASSSRRAYEQEVACQAMPAEERLQSRMKRSKMFFKK